MSGSESTGPNQGGTRSGPIQVTNLKKDPDLNSYTYQGLNKYLDQVLNGLKPLSNRRIGYPNQDRTRSKPIQVTGPKKDPDPNSFTYQDLNKDLDQIFNGSKPLDNQRIEYPFTSLNIKELCILVFSVQETITPITSLIVVPSCGSSTHPPRP